MDIRYNTPPQRKVVTSEESSMPVAAFVLGIVGIFFAFVPIIGTICPATALCLAQLSKGYNLTGNSKSKAAMICGFIGLAICISVTAYTIGYVVTHVSPETFMQEFQQQFNDAYNLM